MAGWPPKGMKMPAGGPAAAQGRRPTGFCQRAQGEEFSRQKAKIKRQKSLRTAAGPPRLAYFLGYPTVCPRTIRWSGRRFMALARAGRSTIPRTTVARPSEAQYR